MKCRWSEAGKGQVRERNGKTQEGGKILEKDTVVQFQNKIRTTRTGIMTIVSVTLHWPDVVWLVV